MKINLSELKAVFLREMEHLEKQGYDHIEINADLYWDIPQNTRYDPYIEPQNFTLGSLSDDWDRLKQILGGRLDPIAYDLVWLSSILRAIAEQPLG